MAQEGALLVLMRVTSSPTSYYMLRFSVAKFAITLERTNTNGTSKQAAQSGGVCDYFSQPNISFWPH